MEADVAQAVNNTFSRFVKKDTLAIASGRQDNAANDYDPFWPINAHPSMFFYGKGQNPGNITIEKWTSVTMQRYPRTQFAQNAGFVMDMFNIIQRHNVNKQAWVQLRVTPGLASSLQSLSKQDLADIMAVLSSKPGLGPKINLTFQAKKLLDGLKQAGGRVPFTPQSYMCLRSKVLPTNTYYHPLSPTIPFIVSLSTSLPLSPLTLFLCTSLPSMHNFILCTMSMHNITSPSTNIYTSLVLYIKCLFTDTYPHLNNFPPFRFWHVSLFLGHIRS